MTAWLAIGLVGAGSYAFRLVPLLLADRWTPGPAAVRSLRHAGVGAISAIAASSLHASSLTGTPTAAIATLGALAAGAERAARGRSMTVVVGTGAAVHLALTAIGTVVS